MTRGLGSGSMAIASIAFFVAACSQPGVEVYDVPKSNTGTQPIASSSTPVTPGDNKGWIEWSAPEAWTELPPTAFRKGNYTYEDGQGGKVEITVSSFPGSVGGTLANVNRWRGQAGLGSISQEQLAASLSNLNVDGHAGQLVDILPESEEPQATRILAAIFSYRGESWFFKMSGPQSLVGAQKPAFQTFIDSLRFTDATSASSRDASTSENANLELAFDAPEGWVESSGSSFRLASYQVSLEGFEPADFSITRFPGDAGGIHANVNRWRQQIGLKTWSAEQIDRNARSIQAGNLEFSLFDLAPRTESEKSAVKERILAAVLKHDDQSYFFKLRGAVFLVETQRSKFRQLIRSARFQPESP